MSSPAESRADVLLVEPDAAEADLAGRCLRSGVAVARDAGEAFQLAQTLSPRVVLLNPRLPGTDGMALLQQLRRDPRFATTPVVVLSSDDAPAGVTRALSLGANSVVVKPVHFESLRAALAEIESYWLGRNAAV